MRSALMHLKKFIIENELVRLFVLAFLILNCYIVFLIHVDFGGADAQWYYYILHDGLIQLRHGLFPTYVGQSIFSAFGGPIIRAPYYILFGQFLDIITLGKLNALSIQHLTIFVSAAAAAFISYFLFVQIAPRLRWGAVAFAFFYISCPGVIGVIYKLDMYYTFMTIPYIPIVLYGLFKTQQENSIRWYIFSAAACALIFMGHPAIAIWTLAVCAICFGLQLIFLRKGFLGIPLFALVFVTLALWQFVSTFALGLGNAYCGADKEYAMHVLPTLKSDLPGVFMPLEWLPKKTTSPYLQLGYTLWFTFIAGVIVMFRYAKTNFALRSFILCVVFFLLLLYPVPGITYLMWSLIPQIVKNITMNWPMQRFYIMLAALICFIGIITLKVFWEQNDKSKHRTLIAFLFLFCFWNLWQNYYFTQHPIRSVSRRLLERKQYWLKEENINFYNTHANHANMFRGIYDPRLKNRLLDQQQKPIRDYDNELVVIQNCATNKLSGHDQIKPIKPNLFPLKTAPTDPFPMTLFRTKLSSNTHYLLCMQSELNHVFVRLVVDDQLGKEEPSSEYKTKERKKHKHRHKQHLGNFEKIYIALTQPNRVTPNEYYKFFEITLPTNVYQGKPVITLPIFSSNMPKELRVVIESISNLGNVPPKQSNFNINSYNLVAYDPTQLPIKIESLTPYTATIVTKTDHTYLEAFKEYYSGYEAYVNGKKVTALRSSNDLVMVPLEKAGLNQVEIVYTGTLSMRVAFWISTLGWIALFSYIGFVFFQTRKVH